MEDRQTTYTSRRNEPTEIKGYWPETVRRAWNEIRRSGYIFQLHLLIA